MLGLGTLKRKVFGSSNDKKIKSVLPTIVAINKLEPDFEKLSDLEIINKTEELKGRALGGESIDTLLPEAFANVREAAKRALGLRAFDVQLMGGIFLHQALPEEKKTGKKPRSGLHCYMLCSEYVPGPERPCQDAVVNKY